jgi:uncharacterized protein YdcH (DUF465 family)
MHVDHHALIKEFPDYRERIHQLKMEDPEFKKLADEFELIDKEICRIEDEIEAASDERLEVLKKKRVFFKDTLYHLLQES